MQLGPRESFEKRNSGLIVNDCSFRTDIVSRSGIPIISCRDAYESTWLLDVGQDIAGLSMYEKQLLAYSMGFCPHLRCQLGNLTTALNGECPTGLCYTKLENGSRSFGACCFINGTFDSGNLIGVASRSQPTAKPIYRHSMVKLKAADVDNDNNEGDDRHDQGHRFFVNANTVYSGLIVTQCPMTNDEAVVAMVKQEKVDLWIQIAPADILAPTRSERYRNCYLLPSLLLLQQQLVRQDESLFSPSEATVDRWALPLDNNHSLAFAWFKHWQDFDIPSTHHEGALLALAVEAAAVLRSGGIVVVSCASGRGRSGSLAALIVALKDGISSHADLVDLIVRLRQHRDGFVETPRQYRMLARLANLPDPAACISTCQLLHAWHGLCSSHYARDAVCFSAGIIASLLVYLYVVVLRRCCVFEKEGKKEKDS